jgi:hypothetical protein
MVGYEISYKTPLVENLLQNATLLRGRAFGRCLYHKGYNLINGLIHL